VFIVMAGAGLVLPILPLFARSFGVGYGAVGLLVSAYGLARLVFDLAAGPIVDRFGERAAAVGGLATVGLGSALTGIASGFPMAVATWSAAGVGSAVALAACTPGCCGSSPPSGWPAPWGPSTAPSTPGSWPAERPAAWSPTAWDWPGRCFSTPWRWRRPPCSGWP
jgi:MFS family permease